MFFHNCAETASSRSAESIGKDITSQIGSVSEFTLLRASVNRHGSLLLASDVALGAIFLELIFDQPKAHLAAAEEQVPKGAAAEDASRLLEGEERDQRDKEDGGVTQEAGQ